MVDPIDRNELLEYVWRCRLDSRERIDNLVRSMPTLPSTQSKSYKAGGCVGCAFVDTEEWNMPCSRCKRNCKDYWRKAQEEGNE